MPSVTVRISEESRETLRDIAESSGQSMQAILEAAIEDLRRQVKMEELNKAYKALHDDPEAWAELEKERAGLDGTLLDGLDLDEVWTKDRKAVRRKKKKS